MPSSTYKQTAKETVDVVTLDEVKLWMRVTHSKEDELIKSLIKSAVTSAENVMGRDILTTTWQNFRDDFTNQVLELEKAKFQSVESVEYLSNGTYTTLATTEYTVREGGIYGVICELTAPTHDDKCNAVRITFKTGFGDDNTSVPEPIKTAIKEHVTFMYQNRGDCSGSDLPKHVMMTYSEYTIIDPVGDRSRGCL